MPFTSEMALLRRSGSAGLVTATAGPDLLHLLPVGRSLRVVKIVAFNNTGADVLFQLGTVNNAGAFVPLLPQMLAIDTMENIWNEDDIPAVEFQLTTFAPGSTGSVYLQSAAVGIILCIEVEEKI
jgi:hypothetical protein